MAIRINSSGWNIRRAGVSRRGLRSEAELPGLPPEFLTAASRVTEEAVLEPAPAARGRDGGSDVIDLSCDVRSRHTAILAMRHPSGALTFHQPIQRTSRAALGPSTIRFQVRIRRPATRGIAGQALKVILIEVMKISADEAISLALPKLAEAVEKAAWKKRGLKEGWLRVTKESLAAGTLSAARPVSPERSLLFIHGTFSSTAAAYEALGRSTFFDRVASTYGDRIFAFDHFSVSRTPEQNARMILDGLPEQTTTFDVVTHSRGGLVLRNLVERSAQFGRRSRRFRLGRAVLVAVPNEGTPLATPKRWEDTVGWIANLLEMLPDNPFTTGAAFVANGLVWLANHASGDLPGLHAMDGDGDSIAALQAPPGPPADAYSALVANYEPSGEVLRRLLDAGIDQFFGTANDLVVPSEGGWRVDRAATGISASRVGCFGRGGNLLSGPVTHTNFFSQPATVDFLVNALLDRSQPFKPLDLRKRLPQSLVDVRRERSRRSTRPVTRVRRPRAPVPSFAKDLIPPAPLRVTVTNGDLTFEREVLMLGHYQSTRLTGTEAVMDRLIGGAMSHALRSGVYPSSAGSHQIFVNNNPDLERGTFVPRSKAVIVVGLGEEGKLRPLQLTSSVRQAVIAWALRLADDKRRRSEPFALATTLIGSGGTGITAGDAALLITQGVNEANTILSDELGRDGTWPRVSHLHFIELYLDRATEAWRSLRMQAASKPGQYHIHDHVITGTGPLQRPPDSGYRGTNYDFITIETRSEEGLEPIIAFTLDSKRARSEVRGQRAQSALIRELVATASSDQNHDERLGRTLFNLLVPIELEPYLTGSGEMVIELDPGTARIPWELLDRDASDPPPWALRVKLLRKLRTAQYRQEGVDADADDSVLIIGEPECPPQYPRLYGARREAEVVRTCLTGSGGLDSTQVRTLISEDPSQPGPDARTVVNTVFERRWRIVHIAGHGMPASGDGLGGVLLSTGCFLGPDEIRNMRTVPELVFVNCCHLADGDEKQLLNYDRASFASGVAGALIQIGVRCVIAAGWAVDDEAASVFAEAFYRSLLRGSRFIDAVADARRAAYEQSPHLNTWAAYQCYGDPDWVFRQSAYDPNRMTTGVDDFSGIGSANSLRLALERIIVQVKYQAADPESQIASLTTLEELFSEKWGDNGDVAELFGQAFVETGEIERGLRWYERAFIAPDGRASMRVFEQIANIRARLAWELVDKARRSQKTPADARRERADGRRRLRRALVQSDRLIRQSLQLLAKLRVIDDTVERASLTGSVYKRQALIDAAVGRKTRLMASLRQMKRHYDQAVSAAVRLGEVKRHDDPGLTLRAEHVALIAYYPASNSLSADVALNAGKPRWRGLDRKTLAVIQKSLVNQASEPDFWSVVGEIELRQYEALARRKLAAAFPHLTQAYVDLHERVAASRMWASVYDTACLVLPSYGDRVGGRERSTAQGLLAQLRAFAHPDEEAVNAQ